MKRRKTDIHIRMPVDLYQEITHKADIEGDSVTHMLSTLINIGLRYWDVRLRDVAELPHVPDSKDY